MNELRSCSRNSVALILLLCLLSACTSRRRADGAAQRYGNAQHTAWYGDGIDASVNSTSFVRLGSGSGLLASPLVLDASSYVVATTKNTIERYDNGSRVWMVDCSAQHMNGRAMAATAQGMVVVALHGGEILAIAPGGTTAWKQRVGVGCEITSDLTISHDRITCTTSNNTVVALDAASGVVRWSVSVEGDLLPSCCAATDGQIYVVSATDRAVVHGIDMNGRRTWSTPTSTVRPRMAPIVVKHTVVIGGTAADGSGVVEALTTEGKVAWTRETPGIPQFASAGGDSLYVVCMEHGVATQPGSRVICFDVHGSELWNVWYDKVFRSPCYVASDCLLVRAAPRSDAVWTDLMVLWRNGRTRRYIDCANERLTTDLPDIDGNGSLVVACADTNGLLRFEHSLISSIRGQ